MSTIKKVKTNNCLIKRRSRSTASVCVLCVLSFNARPDAQLREKAHSSLQFCKLHNWYENKKNNNNSDVKELSIKRSLQFQILEKKPRANIKESFWCSGEWNFCKMRKCIISIYILGTSGRENSFDNIFTNSWCRMAHMQPIES